MKSLMQDNPPFLLICGTSHVGKSTLAASIGSTLGWPVFSTDKMARHPGRPWENTKPHVLEFYTQLSDQTIYTLLRHHHQNMRAGCDHFIKDQLRDGQSFILEGSALRPETLSQHVANTVCLVADADFLRQRIKARSKYDEHTPELRKAIDKFINRSLQNNAAHHAEAGANNIPCIDVTKPDSLNAYQTSFISANR